MADSFRTQLLDQVCPWNWILALVFGMNVILLVLLGMSTLAGSPDRSTEVVTVLAFMFIFGSLVGIAPFLWLCRKHSGYEPREDGGT